MLQKYASQNGLEELIVEETLISTSEATNESCILSRGAEPIGAEECLCHITALRVTVLRLALENHMEDDFDVRSVLGLPYLIRDFAHSTVMEEGNSVDIDEKAVRSQKLQKLESIQETKCNNSFQVCKRQNNSV